MIFFAAEMALFITSLNSGSNGNCYYVANDTEAVLVDAGISCRETEKRMRLLGLSMDKVKAIFISHEHTDHIKGVESIAEKYALPVYITNATAQRGRLHFKKELLHFFAAYDPVNIGKLTVTAFPKFHDAIDPHSFIITGNGVTIGVFTDIGTNCQHVTKHFGLCHAAFLEANYDEVMLEQGRYPLFLKNRIRGGEGHLSNLQALEIFVQHRPFFMTHLLLAHLSKDNNDPEKVKELFTKKADGIEVIVASRYEQTPLIMITANASQKSQLSQAVIARKPEQLSLF
ncbi:MBL fold metallo-hydrolase [Ferruginibacter paludis]|uniref:MBL fold metallo-hydrolase n=1 Tax=Ferruginibacter paludis TaxID=1310417 RepID=UPI0025B61131|nr:MBL fold metallo-hydrolase [Ferruginibacter paludis]MDN3656314.1 MBL fold metallo-hydrolase [Ferruginibacter paludis]